MSQWRMITQKYVSIMYDYTEVCVNYIYVCLYIHDFLRFVEIMFCVVDHLIQCLGCRLVDQGMWHSVQSSCGHHQPTGGCFTAGKAIEAALTTEIPSKAEVKNAWS